MNNLEEKYDIIVVGAGHAGCEAALAAARMGFETICFTVSMDSVALMPCNPNIRQVYFIIKRNMSFKENILNQLI